jgi:hypothetical protein
MEMIDPVKSVTSSSPSTSDRRGQDAPAKPAAPPPPQPAAEDQPLRLVIEPTGNAEGYTYKLFDRATGRLLMELPREDANRMGSSPDYAAGQVFDAKA